MKMFNNSRSQLKFNGIELIFENNLVHYTYAQWALTRLFSNMIAQL